MPTPRPGESRNAYVSRAVKQIMGEGKSQKAAVGKAEGMFSFYSKKGKKKSKKK